MPDEVEELVGCRECGETMNVSGIEPFSVVNCPFCNTENLVNTDFGAYTIVRRLTHGGMSVVYVARDNTLGREVALKILNETYSSDERRIVAFEEEARLTASFSHPHVVKVFTTGKAFGRFFIAMELVPGGHFESYIHEKGKVPESEMLPLAIQIAEGLEAAWQAGLIHRDVKPGNILLDAHGNAKIVDFGLALVTKGGKAKAEELWATPYYVPPETVDGKEEDFRSDIYAFGATLYHALAGVPSCSEETMKTEVLRESKKKVQPLKNVAPHLSSHLCKTVDKATAYDPADRFGSYREMIAELQLAMNAENQAGSAIKTKAVWAAGVGILILAATVGGIAVSKTQQQADEEVPKIQVTSVIETEQEVTAQTSATIAKEYRDARQALKAGNYEDAKTLFTKLRDNPDVQEPTRTFASIEVILACHLTNSPKEVEAETRFALGHLGEAQLDGDDLREFLYESLERLDEPQSIDFKSGHTVGPETPHLQAAQVLLALLAGFDRWRLHDFDTSTEFFKIAKSAPLTAGSRWVSDYQAIAATYLEDAEILHELSWQTQPVDLAELAVELQKSDQIRADLRADGPGLKALEERRSDLEAMAEVLKEPEAEFSEEALRELEIAFQFEDAIALIDHGLKKNHSAELLARQKMNAAAARFMTSLEGRMISAGRSPEINFKEMGPDSIIDLFRLTPMGALSLDDRMDRNFDAVALDWLVGDRARAEAAARKFSEESGSFAQQWDEVEALRSTN